MIWFGVIKDEIWNHKETFEKRIILFEFKEEENIALPLYFVQPEEYMEYFENLSLTQAL